MPADQLIVIVSTNWGNPVGGQSPNRPFQAWALWEHLGLPEDALEVGSMGDSPALLGSGPHSHVGLGVFVNALAVAHPEPPTQGGQGPRQAVAICWNTVPGQLPAPLPIAP